VKSGISTGELPRAIESSDKGLIALQAAASYTSIGGATLFLMDSINALNTKKSIPPCPAFSAF
jgi:hypothetical protein